MGVIPHVEVGVGGVDEGIARAGGAQEHRDIESVSRGYTDRHLGAHSPAPPRGRALAL